MVAVHAEFDQYLNEPVLMPSFTLLRDWITSWLPPSAAGNLAHFIAICHYWTRYWIGRSKSHKLLNRSGPVFLWIVLTLKIMAYCTAVAVTVVLVLLNILYRCKPRTMIKHTCPSTLWTTAAIPRSTTWNRGVRTQTDVCIRTIASPIHITA